MTNDQLLTILEPPIAFHRCLVDLTGSVAAALFLSQAIYYHKRSKAPDGSFRKTRGQWQEETGLTRSEQERARKALVELGVLECRQEGTDRGMIFSVQLPVLLSLLDPIGRIQPMEGQKPPPNNPLQFSNTSNLTDSYQSPEPSLSSPPYSPSSPLSPECRIINLETEPHPNWAEEWWAYLEVRKARHWPVNERWRIKTLAWLNTIEDPKATLQYSTAPNEYQGLFPQKVRHGGNAGRPIGDSGIEIAEQILKEMQQNHEYRDENTGA